MSNFEVAQLMMGKIGTKGWRKWLEEKVKRLFLGCFGMGCCLSYWVLISGVRRPSVVFVALEAHKIFQREFVKMEKKTIQDLAPGDTDIGGWIAEMSAGEGDGVVKPLQAVLHEEGAGVCPLFKVTGNPTHDQKVIHQLWKPVGYP